MALNLPTSQPLPPPPVQPEAGYGHYRAAGVSGGLALARQLDERAGINSLPPVSDPRGLAIRLRYLAWDEQGLAWLRLAQITVTERAIARWKSARQRLLPANLQKLDRAFWACRRHNLVGYYKQRLWDGGRGTQIEIHPVDQQHVAPNRRRALNIRRSMSAPTGDGSWTPVHGQTHCRPGSRCRRPAGRRRGRNRGCPRWSSRLVQGLLGTRLPEPTTRHTCLPYPHPQHDDQQAAPMSPMTLGVTGSSASPIV
ncbi:hypothetical protein ACPC39_33800 [Streptomyces cellulosae]